MESSGPGCGFVIEKRNDSESTAEVYAVEATLTPLFDFSAAYEAHFSLFRHFGLLCPCSTSMALDALTLLTQNFTLRIVGL
jgi:hypothetical protein